MEWAQNDDMDQCEEIIEIIMEMYMDEYEIMIWNYWKLMMKIEIDMDLFKQVINFNKSNINKTGKILAISPFKYYDLINNGIKISNE